MREIIASTPEGAEQVQETASASYLKKIKIGAFSLPVYITFSIIIFLAAMTNSIPNDILGGFAIIMIMGGVLSKIGMEAPVLRNIGGAAILSLMVPSLLNYWGVLPQSVTHSVTTLMKTANFLYLYIAILVCGSMLGMNRQTLVNGIARIFVPMVVGTGAAVLAGLAVGVVLGYSVHHTFFYIIVPIICGGIGEGILPLSIAYSGILNQDAATFVAQMIPAAVIGNIVAIIVAGLLKRLGERKPELSGNGQLVKVSGQADVEDDNSKLGKIDFGKMGAGLLTACTFFIVGHLLTHYIGIPAPIIMIVAAALAKTMKLIPHELEIGSFQLYKFVSSNLTWPLMVGLGMLYVPLKDVVAIISVPYILTCTAVVLAMVLAGFFVGRMINMYPIEAAIVTGCRGGLGGTGDVAILSAANRMSLMPFAQISTRIGGAATVIAATMLLTVWH
jgi:malate:Na+ symporter